MRKLGSLIVLLFPLFAFSQDLTGTWVGEGGGVTFIKMVLIHRGDSLFGYTYDEGGGYCQAKFKGRFDRKNKKLYGRGYEMIDHTPNHVLVDYDLHYIKQDNGLEILRDSPEEKGIIGMLLGSGSVQILRKISKQLDKASKLDQTNLDDLPPIKLKPSRPPVKTSPPVVKKPAPKPIPAKPVVTTKPVVKPTVPVIKKPAAPVTKKPAVIATKPSVPVVKKPVVVSKPAVIPPATKPVIAKASPVAPVKTPPSAIVQKPTPALILKAKEERSSKLVETIYTAVDSIKMFVYDNGEVDRDTVTIFFDNRIILDRYMISDKAKVITLPVLRDGQPHSIELFANNLGTIPPNTALVIIHAGKERHELRASYDLQTNAKIVIQYRE